MTPERTRELLAQAVAKTPDYTVEDIEGFIASGACALWTEGDSVMVTEFVISPRLATLHVFLAAGSWKDIALLKPKVEEWAKQQGCDMIGLTGRPGWGRLLPDYKLVTDTFVRTL